MTEELADHINRNLKSRFSKMYTDAKIEDKIPIFSEKYIKEWFDKKKESISELDLPGKLWSFYKWFDNKFFKEMMEAPLHLLLPEKEEEIEIRIIKKFLFVWELDHCITHDISKPFQSAYDIIIEYYNKIEKNKILFQEFDVWYVNRIRKVWKIPEDQVIIISTHVKRKFKNYHNRNNSFDLPESHEFVFHDFERYYKQKIIDKDKDKEDHEKYLNPPSNPEEFEDWFSMQLYNAVLWDVDQFIVTPPMEDRIVNWFIKEIYKCAVEEEMEILPLHDVIELAMKEDINDKNMSFFDFFDFSSIRDSGVDGPGEAHLVKTLYRPSPPVPSVDADPSIIKRLKEIDERTRMLIFKVTVGSCLLTENVRVLEKKLKEEVLELKYKTQIKYFNLWIKSQLENREFQKLPDFGMYQREDITKISDLAEKWKIW